MHKVGWYCKECELQFSSPNPGGVDIDMVDGTVISERFPSCPFCGSIEIQYGFIECDYCGEIKEFADMETDNICKSCLKEAGEEMFAMMDTGKPMSEQAKEIIKEFWESL